MFSDANLKLGARAADVITAVCAAKNAGRMLVDSVSSGTQLLRGSFGPDTFICWNGKCTMIGHAGDDSLNCYDGAICDITGNAGNDTIDVYESAAWVSCGAGDADVLMAVGSILRWQPSCETVIRE